MKQPTMHSTAFNATIPITSSQVGVAHACVSKAITHHTHQIQQLSHIFNMGFYHKIQHIQHYNKIHSSYKLNIAINVVKQSAHLY
jgi:hypothetical protein